MHSVRGRGAVLRSSIDQKNITPEYVKSVWGKITDMSDAVHLNAIAEASGTLLNVLENLKEGRITPYEDVFKFGSKDLIVYALGVGATTTNPSDLRFLYENDPSFQAVPTFFVMPGLLMSMTSSLVSTADLGGKKADLVNILHGEQYLEFFDELPTSGKLVTYGKILDVMDKGSGAVVVTECNSYDESGNLVVKNQSSIFVVGAGKFGGKKEAIKDVVPVVAAPNRAADSSIVYKTTEDQAALYRMSGDLNPLHIDPSFAAMAGYKTPILHGLCSLGYSVRAVLAKYADNNSSLFKAVKCRFAAPVLPGQTLKVDMWKEGKRIHFRTSIVETGKDVITGAYVDLKDAGAKL